jgi:hypothetical protein
LPRPLMKEACTRAVVRARSGFAAVVGQIIRIRHSR